MSNLNDTMPNSFRIQRLKQQILNAFPKFPPPAQTEISTGTCAECNQLRKDFHQTEWWSVAPEKIFANFGNLSLFTPKAYQYYLPAYMLFALEKFDPYGSVVEFIIYSLRPSLIVDIYDRKVRRKQMFSSLQKEVIISFLRLILDYPGMKVHHEDASAALNFWLA